jgi:cyanophycinase-like exopeptidase
MSGWLVLLGGGEFSFGETAEADRVWLERCGPGPIGFVPAASGSTDYGHHFAEYMQESFGRAVETIPIYRDRDGKRGKNAERIRDCAAVYLGGGVADHLLDALPPGPCRDALELKPAEGGVVVAIAAAAQACGARLRSVFAGQILPGLALAPGLAIDTNFDPGHDRRLRQLLAGEQGLKGVGLAAGSALLLGAGGAFESVGSVFTLAAPEADLLPLGGDE